MTLPIGRSLASPAQPALAPAPTSPVKRRLDDGPMPEARRPRLDTSRPRTAWLPPSPPATDSASSRSPSPRALPSSRVRSGDSAAGTPRWQRPSRADRHPPGNQQVIDRFEAGQASALDVLKHSAASIRRSPDAGTALEQLSRLTQASTRWPALQPNAHIHAAALSALGEHGRLDQALAMLRQWRDDGAALNVHVYAAAFGACLRNGAPERLPHLVHDGMEAGIFEPHLGHDPLAGTVDFHARRLLTPRHHVQHERGVPTPVALAVFDYHFGMANIHAGTTLIVGIGKGVLRELTSELLRTKGFVATDVRGLSGAANKGALKVTRPAWPEPSGAASPARR